MKKQLSKTAHFSMQKEYLIQCDETIRSYKFLLKESKNDLKKALKSIDYCKNKLKLEKQKRKEILNLKP